ncbi:serine hydrolase domain-containing protein [Actinocorallia populi]|uniref:serine hydrolase domain-containing protein n=1 Tax=Actinocorallia populi TaxID=2079200 RepID=UPI000D08FBE3|nr:serine hydrolase domain-containing protein [Actinocorallia populi]
MSPRVLSSDRAALPRWLRTLTASALAVSLAATASCASAGTAAPSVARSDTGAQHARLQELAETLIDAGAPGVIVRVDDGGGRPVEIAEQAPWTRRDHLLRAGDEYRMGSSTKTMMAALVLQLAAEGVLALTDSVEKWLPGKVPGGEAVTLRMLLNHTSGLFDYTEDPVIRPSMIGRDRRRWTSAKLLAVGVRHDPLFAPGAKWSYSNTNYAAIGAVLERATGASLADLVRDRIARPLGLEHTYYAVDATWRGPHARGYERDAAHMPPEVPAGFRNLAGPRRHGHVDVSGNDPGWGGASGAVVSTAQDWSRFSAALLGGELLPPDQLEQMRATVPVDPKRPDGPGYGLGVQTGDTPCGTFWGHDGGLPGYLTFGVADRTGSRTANILISTEFWAEFGADPKIAEVAETLQTTAICAMFGKPVPAADHTG